MNKENVLYDQRQLRSMIMVINKYKPNVEMLELILNEIGSLCNLLNFNDKLWFSEFKILSNKIFWKNEWIIITLDKNKEFFPGKEKLSLEDNLFIKKSYLEIEKMLEQLKDHIKSKIDKNLTDEDVEYKY